MATNISDDCSPPVDFNLSSEIDEIKDKNNGVREKCLLCNNLRTTFYCKICVANGDFYSSTLQNPGTLFLFISSNRLITYSLLRIIFNNIVYVFLFKTRLNTALF